MSIRDAFEVYSTYIALKSHFTSSYDYIAYGGKVSVTPASYEKRRDKYFFQKLSARRDWFEFLLANMIQDPTRWIGDIVRSDECETIYRQFNKRVQSLTYNFKSEVGQLDQNFNSNFIVVDGQHPPILRKFLKDEISPETLIILDDLTGCFKHWNNHIGQDFIWSDIYRMCAKYKPFLAEIYDREKMRLIVANVFQDV